MLQPTSSIAGSQISSFTRALCFGSFTGNPSVGGLQRCILKIGPDGGFLCHPGDVIAELLGFLLGIGKLGLQAPDPEGPTRSRQKARSEQSREKLQLDHFRRSWCVLVAVLG